MTIIQSVLFTAVNITSTTNNLIYLLASFIFYILSVLNSSQNTA